MNRALRHGAFEGIALGFLIGLIGCGPTGVSQPDSRRRGAEGPEVQSILPTYDLPAPAANAPMAADDFPVVLPRCCQNVAMNDEGSQSEWISMDDRVPTGSLTISCEDTFGRQATLGEWLSQPSLVMFFYSRCDNPLMCARTFSLASTVLESLPAAAEAANVRLVLITYEPKVDTPEILKSFAARQGIDVNDARIVLLRPFVEQLPDLLSELSVPVGFSFGTVAIHDHAGYLFDSKGQIARVYLGVLPEKETLIEDLNRLAAEQREFNVAAQFRPIQQHPHD